LTPSYVWGWPFEAASERNLAFPSCHTIPEVFRSK
jgi:hypothetical protein